MSTQALEDLRKRVSEKDTEIVSGDIFKGLDSVLNLLASSKQPLQIQIHGFQELFSNQIVVLYDACPAPALRLSASIITECFKSHLSPLLKPDASNTSEIKTWEDLLRGIFNGIQTHIEGEKADTLEVGRALYKPVLAMLVSASGQRLSARIRTQAYALLADAAEANAQNRELLKQKSILGGVRLGGIIASTNEYLVLDYLFQILARLTPSTNDPGGRTALAKDVFQNAKVKKAFGKESCDELSTLLQNASGEKWETTTDRIIAAIARTDPLKPQPFRLMSEEIYANSSVYTHPQTLDRIYLDCTGFVVNVQEGENIDSLEIDYRSVTSVQLTEMSADRPNPSVRVSISLSSPPTIGLDSVSESRSGATGHQVMFEIALKDSDGFKKALQARGIGALVRTGDSWWSKIKSSVVAGGPLDLNGPSVASIEAKAKEVETYISPVYATSSPQIRPRQQESENSKQTHEFKSLTAMQDDNIVPATSKVRMSSDRRRKDLKNEGGPVAPNRGISSPINLQTSGSKTVVDLDESLTDLESFNAAEFVAFAKTTKSKTTSAVKQRKEAPQKRDAVKLPRTDRHTESKPEKALANVTQTFSKAPKRKRVLEDSDDEEFEPKAETVSNIKSLYNSQLLMPRDTATTRSTTKYKARTRKSSSSPSRLSDINFDAIPLPTSPSVPRTKFKSKPAIVADSVPMKAEKADIKNDDIKTSSKAGRMKQNMPPGKKIKENAAQDDSIATRRIKRPVKKPRIIESEDEPDDLAPKVEASASDETKQFETIRLNLPQSPPRNLPKVGEKTKKSKTAPWKNLDQSDPIVDVLPQINSNLNGTTETHSAVMPKPVMESPHIERHTEANSHPTPVKSVMRDEITLDTRLLFGGSPPGNLEPLDLDLAVAEVEDFVMDVDHGFNPVDSTTDAPTTAVLIGAPEEVVSNHGTFEAGMTRVVGEQYKNIVDSPKVSILKRAGRSKARMEKQPESSSPVVHSPLMFSPKAPLAPSRRVKTIDLTHIDDEDDAHSRFAEEKHEEGIQEQPHAPGNFVEQKRIVPGAPQRPSVTFAHNTNNSPAQVSRTALNLSLANIKIAKAPSLIPRLKVTRDRDEGVAVIRMDGTKTHHVSRVQRKNRLPEIPRRSTQPTRTPPVDYESVDDSDHEMSVEEKIVTVLNKIQEVILGNMNNKFNGAATHARIATEGLRSYAAEDIQEMRARSGDHCKDLVRLEEEYAEYGRKIRHGFEEQNKANEDIDKRLRQAVLDHDRNGLSRKMPKKLASRPKIFQTLAVT